MAYRLMRKRPAGKRKGKGKMTSCEFDDKDQRPALTVYLQGRGEDAMRMEKRLRCAGRALGVNIQVEWDAAEFGAPRVTAANRLLTDHLVSTEELEALLREYLKPEERRL